MPNQSFPQGGFVIDMGTVSAIGITLPQTGSAPDPKHPQLYAFGFVFQGGGAYLNTGLDNGDNKFAGTDVGWWLALRDKLNEVFPPGTVPPELNDPS